MPDLVLKWKARDLHFRNTSRFLRNDDEVREIGRVDTRDHVENREDVEAQPATT